MRSRGYVSGACSLQAIRKRKPKRGAEIAMGEGGRVVLREATALLISARSRRGGINVAPGSLEKCRAIFGGSIRCFTLLFHLAVSIGIR